MAHTLIIAEQRAGSFKRATLASVTFAKQVGGSYDILVIGHQVAGVAQELTGYGAAHVYVADKPELANPVAEYWKQAAKAAVEKSGATHVAMTASTIAKDFMPRLAAALKAGMASEVVAVLGPNKFKRPMWAGNVIGHVQIATDKLVVTVRATDFEKAAPSGGSSPIVPLDVPIAPQKVRFVKFEPSVSARPELTEANVVVAGGRGMKAAENFDKVLGPLADLLNAAVGATRAAVDAGMIHNDYQVGQTGKVVAPNLYFAVGLSGAIQHLAGMKASKTIVAINKDEEAPIFSVADYGLVADLFGTVPELVERLRKAKGA